jgi:carbonic anhydrase/acetyltransferase-like protein (isoleucine patch superfamily)
VRVYRHARVRVDGTLEVNGSLDIGCQWPGSNLYVPGQLYVGPGATLRVADEFRVFTGSRILLETGATLTLGSGYLNLDSRVQCFSSISIGAGVFIGEQVIIRDSDSHELQGGRLASTAPIAIGNHVWIGTRAMILKGVSVGDGAVVAAGAVVTRDVPAGSLVAGVPAEVRRTDVSWR